MHSKCFVLFIVITVCVISCSAKCNIYGNTVSQKDAKIIVDKHNEFRLLIAKGKLPGQPRGVNLKRLKYDAKLAAEAQKIANSCEFKHKPVHDGRFSVGQNLYMSMSSSGSDKSADWSSAVQSWFNEHKSYKYGKCCDGFEKTGHYTQVVWANTQYVGCGFTFFEGDAKWRYKKIYVCNYGPAGNIGGQTPYITGSHGCENLC